jgi:hypothetical protein
VRKASAEPSGGIKGEANTVISLHHTVQGKKASGYPVGYSFLITDRGADL